MVWKRWILLDMAIFVIYVKFLAVVSLELYFCKPFFLISWKKTHCFVLAKVYFINGVPLVPIRSSLTLRPLLGTSVYPLLKGSLGGYINSKGTMPRVPPFSLWKIPLYFWNSDGIDTLPETLKRGPAPKENVIFQSLIFKGELLVSRKIHFCIPNTQSSKANQFSMARNHEKQQWERKQEWVFTPYTPQN